MSPEAEIISAVKCSIEGAQLATLFTVCGAVHLKQMQGSVVNEGPIHEPSQPNVLRIRTPGPSQDGRLR